MKEPQEYHSLQKQIMLDAAPAVSTGINDENCYTHIKLLEEAIANLQASNDISRKPCAVKRDSEENEK